MLTAEPSYYQLLYISSVMPGVDVDLDAILRVSRRNNLACNVTGLLMFNGKRFIQVLEGPTDAVTETYRRIGSDARHRAAVVLSQRLIQEREFGDWSMGYKSHDQCDDADLFERLSDRIKGTSPSLRAELLHFARQISS